jgi:hypothetical protein
MAYMDAPSEGSSGLANLLRRLDDDWLTAHGGPAYMHTILSIDWIGNCDRVTDLVRRVDRTMAEGIATRIAARDAEEHRRRRAPGDA